MAELKCQVSDDSESAGSDSIQGLTVGQVFELRCEGDLSSLDPAVLGTYVVGEGSAKPDLYALKVLSTVDFQPSLVRLRVTSYQVGQHPQGAVYLTDGKTQFQIRGPTWSVKSVIEVKEGEQPQPFGPVAAFHGSLGNLVWIFLGAAVVLWLSNFAWEIRERRRLRKLFESLAQFQTRRSPLDEFYTEVRALDRKYNFAATAPREVLKELFQSYRMFLVRQLMVPAHEWTLRKVVSEMRKRDVTPPPTLMADLKKCWQELESSQMGESAVDARNLQQTVVLARLTVEKIGDWAKDHPEGLRR